ncbi:MAG: response regulator [Bilophila wadsworthia]
MTGRKSRPGRVRRGWTSSFPNPYSNPSCKTCCSRPRAATIRRHASVQKRISREDASCLWKTMKSIWKSPARCWSSATRPWTGLVTGSRPWRCSASPQNHYDAVLADVRMPVMDGIAATQAIRGLDRADAATVPILAMTANAFAEDIERSRKAGMNEHLAKPIEPETLYARLASYFR